MRKLILSFCLLTLPIAYSYGQLSVSGVAGRDGYSVLRASFGTPFIVPGLTLKANYAMFEQDNMSTMSRYSLGANYQLPFIDIVEVGAEAGFQPKANQYSNNFYDINASVNLYELLFRMVPTDELRLGAGYRRTNHEFHDPSHDVGQSDFYTYLSQRTGGFDASVYYMKALSYTDDLGNLPPPWLETPNFVSVYHGFLDYSLGASAGYTYQFIRPYVAYNLLKTKNSPDSDNMRLGVTFQLATISVNAAMEWLNFTKNTDNRQRNFAISAGVKFL